MERQKRFRVNFLVSAMIYISFGLVLALQPDKTASVVCYLISVLVLAVGIYNVFLHFKNNMTGNSGRPLVNGLFLMGVSVFAFFNIVTIMGAIPIILSFAIIYNGLIKLNQSLDMQKLSYTNWWYVLISAAIGIMYGVVMLINPFGEMKNLLFIGIGLVYSGVSDLVILIWGKETCESGTIEKEEIELPEEKEE